MREAALLLLGHGSTLNADSSAPTYQHADTIRRRRVFAEVHVGFWKEEPNFRQALRQASCRTVYVVPNFISSGYFTEQIIPRELGLTGPTSSVEGKTVHYCQPVGLNPAMTEVLLQRASNVVSASGEPCDAKQTCLFICGHGTSMNDNSTKIIHEQAGLIRALGLYADCQGVLMEQRPFVKDWRTLTPCLNVIVVPFFISDGLHSYEDIPVLLGLTHNMREKGFTNPHREGERRLWYASAIGTTHMIADVILESVAQFDADHFNEVNFSPSAPKDESTAQGIKRLFESSPSVKIGQVIIKSTGDTSLIQHVDSPDLDMSEPRGPLTEDDWRTLVLRDQHGNFRPLRSAPNLLPGSWIIVLTRFEKLLSLIDHFYPAAIANWALWKRNELPVTPWHETAQRQTGRFRILRELGDSGVRELAAQVCDRGCLKRRLWSPCAQDASPVEDGIPLLCPEACNYFVSKAREKLKGPESEAE
jgi:sirohydrochlorin cobaltochelatase